MNVKGTLIQILNPESGVSKGGKEWTKQDFVIETNEQYPKNICFTLFGDKSSLISPFGEGQEIDVHFNIESRDFNGKWFHNVTCWKIELVSGGKESAPTYESHVKPNPLGLPPSEMATQNPIEDDGNDLPF